VDGLPALDPGGQADRPAGFVQRWSLSPRLVGAGVRCRAGRTRPGSAEGAVRRGSAGGRGTRAVASPRTAPPKEFARGDRTGAVMVRMPLPANTSPDAGVSLRSRSRIKNPKWPARSPRSMSRLRACWGGPGSGGVHGDAQDVHPPGPDLHHGQDVQAPEEHGVQRAGSRTTRSRMPGRPGTAASSVTPGVVRG
jgi:hypothetical protein